MEFVKEFAIFLHKNNIIKFGDFTLASGKRSPFYMDLRLVPSYPVEFRRMVKSLQNTVSDKIGLDSFEAWASVPTGGLVIASALATETIKPVIYARSKPKGYGTAKLVEGRITDGMRAVMVDDVATTGGSVVQGIKALRDAGVRISDACVVINRLEGATEAVEAVGVQMHSLTDILEIANILFEEKLATQQTLDRVREQVNSG